MRQLRDKLLVSEIQRLHAKHDSVGSAETYASEEARVATYYAWLHRYNHHRPHTGIGGRTPSDRVHNLTRNYS